MASDGHLPSQNSWTQFPHLISLKRETLPLNLKLTFVTQWPEPIRDLRMIPALGLTGKNTVLGRQYLTRQAMTLLNLAKTTTDPKVAAGLLDKAADLKSKVDESTLPDQSPLAPD